MVNVNNLPTADAGADQAICINGSTTLTASGGVSYSWSSGESTASITVSPTATATYTVTVTDANGCTDDDSVTVTVNPLPVADAGADQTICDNDNATLTATGGTIFTWSTGANTASITVSPNTTTTYTVTVTDANGCSDEDSVTVNVNPLPVADAGADQTICVGFDATLTASGGTSYSWSSGENTASITVSPAVTTTYTVTVTDVNGCTDEDSVMVNVNNLPTADAGADQAICINGSTTLTASGGVSYSWSSGESTASITVSPTATATYTVTVTDANGCTDDDSVTVTVNPLPVADAGADQTICDNDNATLTATGGTIFTWSTGANTASITVSPNTTTTYTVTVTDANGCSDEDSVTVNVNPLPVADAGADQTICVGFDATLTASGGTSYSWSSGENTASITVSPVVTTTYTVTVTDVNGCTDEDSVTVTVNNLPTADAGADQAICINGSTTLTATGGVLYSWSSGENTASITVSPTATATYTVTVTDANGCTDDDSVTVTVNPLPVADAGADQTICDNDNATLTATGGTIFTWSTGANTASITVSPNTTTTYTVTVTDANGCSDEDSVTVNVNPLPVANAGADQTICVGFDATLTASGGTSYSWSSGENTANITVSPAVTTTYTVTVTDVNGCTDEDSVTVNVNNLPTADAGADQAICLNEVATLTASGGTDYVWSTGETTSSITVTPVATATYSVTVSDGNGCSAEDTVEVTVNPLPVADAGADVTICEEDDTTLTASGGIDYVWSTGEVTASITVSPTATATYTVTVTDANGCSDEDSVTVNVNPHPVADAGADMSICVGESTTLTASGNGTYSWSTGESTTVITVAPTATTTYTVTVTDAVGCSDVADVTVTVNPLPIVSAGADQNICIGEAATLTGTGAVEYEWSTGETTPGITVVPNATTTYFVTATDANGCVNTASVLVTVNDLPTADAGSDQTICADELTNLTASGGISYEWSTGETTATIAVNPAATTVYTVTVTDANGCSDEDSVMVNVNPLPVANAGADQSLCEGAGTITLTASGGVSYLWSGGQTTATITVSPTTTTTYTVTVSDAIGCSDEDSVTVTVGEVPVAEAGADQFICIGGSANLSATGGVDYLWSTGETVPDITVTPAATTTYTVTITAANGCSATDAVTVSVNALPIVDAGGDQTVCELESATLTATGGVNYEWSNGETGATITVTPTVTTSYSVTVTDANGCSAADVATVTVEAIPLASAGPDQSLCEGIGTVSLTASGGNGYVWSTGETSATITVSPLTTTVYTVTVSSANGCSATDAATVFVGTVPVIDAGADQSICQGETATITVTGTNMDTYLWSNGATTNQITVAPLTNTNYAVTVTSADGCTAVDVVSVNVNTTPIAGAGTDQSICNGEAVTLTATGGGTYTWSNGSTNASIAVTPSVTTTYTVTITSANGCTDEDSVTVFVGSIPVANAGADVSICEGGFTLLTATGGGSYLWSNGEAVDVILVTPVVTTTYTVTVTNAEGCSAQDAVTVTITPPVIVSATTTNATCFDGGSINLSVTGGVPPYSYAWSGGLPPQPILTNLVPAGTYTVTVTDANNCEGIISVTVDSDNVPDLVPISAINATCEQNNGSAEVLGSGGVGALTYSWSHNPSLNSPVATNLFAGAYTVSVTDENGCLAQMTIDIFNQASPALTVSNIGFAYCEQPTGNVSVQATGGTGTLTYQWEHDPALNSPSAINLLAGTYSVTVTDANGCTAAISALVFDIPGPTITAITSTDDNCNNSVGSATVTASGGSGLLTYSWAHNPLLNSPNATGLGEGDYSVTVTDVNGCSDSATVTVNNSAGPSVTLNNTVDAVCGEANGSATVSVSGGLNPITYSWSHNNGLNSPTATGLSVGGYTVSVSDASGCVTSLPIAINEIGAPGVSVVSISGDACGQSNGSITITATGGSGGTFTYTWSHNASLNDVTATGLSAGNYFVTVTDSGGCAAIAAATVPAIAGPSVQLAALNADQCGQGVGNISINPISGVSPYDFTWSHNNSLNSPNATGLNAGLYTVTVTDANGCTASFTASVGNIAGPSLSVLSTTPAICGQANGGAVVLATGGGGSYTFGWSQDPALNSPSASGLLTGTYNVTVTDANGCSVSIPVIVPSVNGPNLNIVNVTNATCGASNGSASVVASGGTGPYDYDWSHSTTLSGGFASNIPGGAYGVTVTDANGCIATVVINVGNLDGPELFLNPTNPTCSGANGNIQALAVGGGGGYSYSWSHNSTLNSATANGLSAGAYTVTLTDGNGCSTSASVTLTSTTNPNASAAATNASCGLNNGSINLSVSGGTTPYTFSWSNGASTEDLNNLAPGTYTVTVTATGGCTATASALVNNVAGPTVSTIGTDATCGNNNGSVNLSVSGGTAQYGYAWSNGVTSESLLATAPGFYTVTVTDANGCTAVTGSSVGNINGPTASATAAVANCGNADGSVALTVSGGFTPYSYAWSSGATTPNLTNVLPGIYIVTVTDLNNCTATATATVTNEGGPAATALAADATCGNADGSVTLTVTGGTAPYTYAWSNTATTQNLNNVVAGSYAVTVADANGCVVVAGAVVNNPGAPTLSLAALGATCGIANGSVTSSVSGGAAPFTYVWSNGALTPNLSNVSSGSYTLTLTDATGCVVTAAATVADAPGPLVTATATDATCGNADGTVQVTVSGGTAPYTYLWDNGAITEDLNAVAAGIYTVTVTDANGCTALQTALVNNLGGPTAAAVAADATCDLANGSVQLTITGGTTPYTYQWSNGATTQNLTNVVAGAYSFTITDVSNCVAFVTTTIYNLAGPTATALAADATCGAANGSVNVTVTGGTEPFTYVWSNGALTEDLTNIAAGIYLVTVTDANGCTATANATVTNIGAPTAAAATTDAACGNADGGVDITVSGGTAPYTYLWNGGQTSEDLNNVAAGLYSVTITDANNCTVALSATVNNIGGPIASSVALDATCGNANGSVNATVTGGTAPYTYLWSNGATTEDISGLTAGTYTLTVSDDNGCVAVTAATVNNLAAPSATAVPTDATCGNADGSVDATITGGATPYTYQWSNGATTEDLTGVGVGVFTLTVTDANGCTATVSATVNNIGGPSALAVATNATCENSNGSINLTVSGGTAPYAFVWSNGATSEDLTGLDSGIYFVTVTDANNCEVITNATVTNSSVPNIVTITATDATAGNANGSVDLTVSGGTAPYAYQWSNGDTAEDLTNVPAGTYSVTVTDANGCTATASVDVGNVGCPTIAAVAADATCGNADGSVDLTVTAGTPPFIYNWSNGAATEDLPAVSSGIYLVTVTDANGCSATTSATVTNIGGPSATAVSATATCGNANGGVDVTVSGGTAPYTYQWTGGSTSEDLTNVLAGSYTVTVTDANSCVVVVNATVTNIDGATLAATAADATCNLANGGVDVTVTGGTPPFTFQWTGGSTLEDLTNVAAGTYTVTLTDANSCTGSAAATVSNIPAPVPAIATTDAACGSADGTVDLTVSGGTAPYTYNWNNGTLTEDLTNVAAGIYLVTITDANSCNATASAVINNFGGPTASAAATDAACGQATGTVTLTVSGGNAPFTYNWSNGAITQNLSNVLAGDYDVTITDALGCVTNASATVGAIDGPTAAVTTVTDATCGNANGGVDITVSGGTAPYAYQWTGGNTLEDLTNVLAGTYTVTVTDANGCTTTALATVNNIDGPAAAAVATDATCGNANGGVDVTVSGGTAPYTYQWTGGSTLEDLTNVLAGTYTVTVTDANGCTTTALATVNNIAGPTATAAAVSSTCGDDNGSVDITVTGGTAPFTYTWSNGATTEDLTDVAAGAYSTTITDANGCTTTAQATVTNIPGQTVLAVASGSTCGNANGSVDVTVTGGTAPFTYAWSNGATTEDLTNVLAGSYTITVTDANGCTAETGATVADTDGPITATAATDATCGNANGSINLTVTGGTAPYSYTWSNGATTEDITNLLPGAYAVTVTDANGCTSVATANLINLPQPVAFFSGPASVCLGDAATFTFTGVATPGMSYNWNFGSAGQLSGMGPHTVVWGNTGVETVTLTVTDANGCTGSFSQTITISAISVVATIQPDGLIAPGESVLLSAIVNAVPATGIQYEWTATSGTITCPTCPTTTATPDEFNTIYNLTVYNVNGCSATASVSATWEYEKQVVIPNAFSPNGDGRNDIFRLAGINIARFELYVYDRWGGNMFAIEDTDIGKGWDGTHNGIDCELGVYVYYAIVTFTDGTTEMLKGNVTLIR